MIGHLAYMAALMAPDVASAITTRFAEVLSATNVSLVSGEELGLLRDVAAAAVTGVDVDAALARLKAFHLRQAAEVPAARTN